MNNEETGRNLPVSLIQDLNIADNQLGSMAGHAIAALLLKSKSITALDVSNNSLGFAGGTDALVKCYEMIPKDFFKRLLRKIENSKYEGRYAKKKIKVYTNLISLNLCRNGLGPLVASGLMSCIGGSNCTLTNVDVSDNPLGFTLHKAGYSTDFTFDIRYGLSKGRSLVNLDC